MLTFFHQYRISSLKIFFILVTSVAGFTASFAQVGISTTTITPDASSILELRSTTKGFLPPRMTTTERDAITTPATGLVIFNTTTGLLNFYNSSSWQISNGGSVTNVSVATANGFGGSVATASTTPVITLSTSISGVLKGNGTAISAAVSGTDYQAPISLTTTGTSGAATFSSNTLNIPQYAGFANPMTTLGDVIFGGSSGAPTRLAGNTTATNTFLRSIGNAGVATAPTFSALVSADIPNNAANTTGTASNITGVLNATSFPALTGDVTTTSGSVATTIANNAVSLAKFQQIATNSLLGRSTAATGNAEVITVGTGLALSAGTLSATNTNAGTVTSVSVATANGFAGTVATATTTPAITVSTNVTGVLKGNGTAISAATSGTDYSAGTSALATGILKSTATTGALTTAVAADFPTLNQNTTGTAASFTGSLAGDVTGTQGATVVGKINGVSLAGLATGIVRNTTTTGVPSIAVAADFPTLNQNTTGTASNITGVLNATSHPALTGDVTTTSGSVATTIANNAVSLAKFQQIATNSLLGRSTAATGNAEVITVGSGLALSAGTLSATNTNAGTVTSVSVATANGFAGTVATPTTTPAITVSTNVTGVLKGNGTAISAATSGTDYSAGTSALATGILKSTTATGALTTAVAADFPTLNQNTTGTAASFTGSLAGDVTGTQGATVVGKINGVSLAGLTTGILKNTTTTGVPSIAVAADFPTLNQNTTGTASNVTGTVAIANGGTNIATIGSAGSVIYSNGTQHASTAVGNTGEYLKSGGTGAPTWVAGETIVTLGTDVVNSNATANTIADVTGLSFSVTSGVTYRFQALIIYTSAATNTGSRWSINGPATPTLLAYSSSYSLTVTSMTFNNAVAYDIPTASNATSANTAGNICKIEGIIIPSANGTVIIRFASEIAGSAITAKAGSTLTWW